MGGDDTRISNSVQNDKKVNVFEFFYILNKWNITEIRFSIFENIILFFVFYVNIILNMFHFSVLIEIMYLQVASKHFIDMD